MTPGMALKKTNYITLDGLGGFPKKEKYCVCEGVEGVQAEIYP